MKHSNQQKEKSKEAKFIKEEELGGPKGLEPTRYGVETPEWEVKGRVSDF